MFTRASGFLWFWFVLALIDVGPSDTIGREVLKALVGVGAPLLGWMAWNRLRGRQALALPERVGPLQLAGFVLIPALVPLLNGSGVDDALLTLLIQVGVLALTWLVASWALISLVVWAIGRMFRQFSTVVDLFARALPLLLVAVIFSFMSSEVWQAIAAASAPRYFATLGLLYGVAVAFLFSRVRAEIAHVSTPLSREQIIATLPAAGLADVCTLLEGLPWREHPLGRREWTNLGLIIIFRQMIQVWLVSIVVGAFLLLLGLTLLSSASIELWAGAPPENLLRSLGLDQVFLSRELVEVAGFVAAFSGLYFAVYLKIDRTYRAEFYEEIVAEVQQTLAVRQAYRTLLDASSQIPRTAGSAPASLPQD
ncbi:MAG: hypothetical protein DCC58_01045 [Chloroflexi bacterium]|nr:MAG: hypothetical protein DCC58_01045 [Chloroflexota bacterium]